MRHYRRLVTTATVTKTGVSALKKVIHPVTDETARQRHARLAEQGSSKVNHARVKNLGNGTFNVQSQRKGPDGKAVDDYNVVWTGGAWLCQCAFGVHQPGVECTHVARVIEYAQRNKLAFGTATVADVRSESEQLTDAWIERNRESRKARGRVERAEEV